VESELFTTLGSLARPLRTPADLDPLVERAGTARCVLLGEPSHGAHESTTWRAVLSRRLIAERGFRFIAVDGNAPDCARINLYAKGRAGSETSARELLRSGASWPAWLWANNAVAELVEWLREHNQDRALEARAGLYGLDAYGLWRSLCRVLGYLRTQAPEAVPLARAVFQCFEPYTSDTQAHARATRWLAQSSEDQIVDLLCKEQHAPAADANGDPEAAFDREQQALAAQVEPWYYRTLLQGGPQSWNVREQQLMETLDRWLEHHGPDAQCIVWAHNTHAGDARFTDMFDDGMVSIGQLVRERYGPENVLLVGSSSYRGRIVAARDWEGPTQRIQVPPAREGSWDEVLHRSSPDDKLLLWTREDETPALLAPRGQRAIGVVYRPEREGDGNYVPTVLTRRYDALVHVDETDALSPLHEIEAEFELLTPDGIAGGVRTPASQR
jgi:erythromycin esterase-like protein